jgi:hypothetical protein
VLGETSSAAQLRFAAGSVGKGSEGEESGSGDSASFEGRSFLLNLSTWQPDDNALDFERLFATRTQSGRTPDGPGVVAAHVTQDADPPTTGDEQPPPETAREAEARLGSAWWPWVVLVGACLTPLPVLWWSRRLGGFTRRRHIPNDLSSP